MNKNDIKNLTKQIRQAFTEEQLLSLGIDEKEINNYRKYKIIPVQLIVKAEWNYKDDNTVIAEKLKNNLKRNGQVENVIVRLLPNGLYEVCNGNHRFDEILRLGREFILAYDLGSVTLAEAQRITIETNETKFNTDRNKLTYLIHDLNTEFGFDSLIETMPYNQTDLQAFEYNYDQLNNNSNDSDNNDSEDNSEHDSNLKFKKLTLNLTKEVYQLWDQWKERFKEQYPDEEISDNKIFEFAMAEALNS